jgi:hypothetical protein
LPREAARTQPRGKSIYQPPLEVMNSTRYSSTSAIGRSKGVSMVGFLPGGRGF